jgi:hypothetical protein
MIGMLCSFDIEFWIIFVIGSSTKLENLVLKWEINWVMGSHLDQQVQMQG